MQTFLPHPDYRKSAEALDRQRLGKQRVEVFQILKQLAGISDGWENHPAVKMWCGYEFQLACYGFMVCDVWKERGYEDNTQDKIVVLGNELKDDLSYPDWLGDERLHRSHRGNLLRKDPEHYGQFDWSVDEMDDYFWPV